MPNYLTPADVAQRLRVRREMVYAWIKEGKLLHSRISAKLIRISEDDLNAFLEEKRMAKEPAHDPVAG